MSSVLDGPYTPAKMNLVKGSVYEGCTHAAFDAYRDRGRPTLNCTEMQRIDFSLPSCVAIFLWRREPFGFHPSSLCRRCIYCNQMWLIVLDSALQRCHFAIGQPVPGPMARTIFRMDGSLRGGCNLLKRKMSRSLPPSLARTSHVVFARSHIITSRRRK